MTAKKVAYFQARNYATFGQELYELSGDESEAKIVMSVWPDEESRSYFGLSREDTDAMNNVIIVIVDQLGYDCIYSRQGDILTVTFLRRD